MSFPVLETCPPFAYQHLAKKAHELSRLGMSVCVITRALQVTDKTIAKALRFAAETRLDHPRKYAQRPESPWLGGD
jgi:uncharacterized protein (DUF2252 family)